MIKNEVEAIKVAVQTLEELTAQGWPPRIRLDAARELFFIARQAHIHGVPLLPPAVPEESNV